MEQKGGDDSSKYLTKKSVISRRKYDRLVFKYLNGPWRPLWMYKKIGFDDEKKCIINFADSFV